MKDRAANNGIKWEFFSKVTAKYDILFKQSDNTQEVIETLKQGAYVVCSIKPGKFTKGGHYIIAWNFKDGNRIVHDPTSTLKERTYGDIRTFETQCKQYFIFNVDQKIENPTLNRGTKNGFVKTLQELLNRHGYRLSVDGDFGAITDGAVSDFQRIHGFTDKDIDGIVGTKTWNKLYGV